MNNKCILGNVWKIFAKKTVLAICMAGMISVVAVEMPVQAKQDMEAIQVNASKQDWDSYAAKSFAKGTGTKSDPYQISNEQELALLAKKVNAGNLKYMQANYKLTADLDLKKHYWIPIGYFNSENGEQSAFLGTFDGNHHTIKNVKIRNGKYAMESLGFFGQVYGAAVKNIVLDGEKITVDKKTSEYSSNDIWHSAITLVGGLVGNSSHSNIENCTVRDISVKANTIDSLYCGGIMGSVSGLLDGEKWFNASVSKCNVENAKMDLYARLGLWSGGMVGFIDNHVSVNDCKVECEITAESDGRVLGDMYYQNDCGGFVGMIGYASSTIKISDCYAKGSVVTSSICGYDNAGGFAGDLQIVYDKCFLEHLLSNVYSQCRGMEVRESLGCDCSSMYDDLETNWHMKNVVDINGKEATILQRQKGIIADTIKELEKSLIVDELGFGNAGWNYIQEKKHEYITAIQGATWTSDGYIRKQCKYCGDVKKETIIYALDKIEIANPTVTIGKTPKFNLIVTDRNGKVVPEKYYYLNCPSKLEEIGDYTAYIIFNGKYSLDPIPKDIQVVPKGTKFTKLTGNKSAMTLKWKTKKQDCSGYEIRYSESSTMKNAATVTAKKAKTDHMKISQLKAKATYYVQIRTYKSVGGKRFRSNWSKIDKLITK